MQWLSEKLSKGPAIKADILDAGTELKGSKIGWKVHEGKLKETKEPCTVFTWEMTASSTDNELAAARNAIQRLKKTRHPTVLQYLDGVDPEAAKPGSKVIIVTEHVKPLEECLAKEPAASNREGTAWGLNSIAQALQFITEDCGLIHGNVSRSAIFVSDCGDWKLSGFELMAEKADTNSLLRRCEQLRTKRVLPPEVAAQAYAFRKLVEHLQLRPEIQNIDIMNLTGFCRNCLSKWYAAGMQAQVRARRAPPAPARAEAEHRRRPLRCLRRRSARFLTKRPARRCTGCRTQTTRSRTRRRLPRSSWPCTKPRSRSMPSTRSRPRPRPRPRARSPARPAPRPLRRPPARGRAPTP